MVEAFNIVQDRIARSRLAGDPPDAMINLRLSDMGLFDFHRADESDRAAARKPPSGIWRRCTARSMRAGMRRVRIRASRNSPKGGSVSGLHAPSQPVTK